MKILNPIVLLAASLTITACNSPAMNSMDIRKNLSDPTYRKTVLSECATMVSYKSANFRENMATLIGTSEKNVTSVFCKRLVDGIASGRITRSDLDSSNSSNLPPRILKVIMGH